MASSLQSAGFGSIVFREYDKFKLTGLYPTDIGIYTGHYLNLPKAKENGIIDLGWGIVRNYRLCKSICNLIVKVGELCNSIAPANQHNARPLIGVRNTSCKNRIVEGISHQSQIIAICGTAKPCRIKQLSDVIGKSHGVITVFGWPHRYRNLRNFIR